MKKIHLTKALTHLLYVCVCVFRWKVAVLVAVVVLSALPPCMQFFVNAVGRAFLLAVGRGTRQRVPSTPPEGPPEQYLNNDVKS